MKKSKTLWVVGVTFVVIGIKFKVKTAKGVIFYVIYVNIKFCNTIHAYLISKHTFQSKNVQEYIEFIGIL